MRAGRPSHEALEELDAELEAVFGDRLVETWIEPSGGTETLGIGIVDPTAEEVLDIHQRSADKGWVVTVVGMRYSRKELDGFKDRIADEIMATKLDGPLIGVGASRAYTPGKVFVELNARDRETIERVQALLPPDAVAFEIRPGARYVAL